MHDSPAEELLQWIKVHVLGFKMRHDAMSREIDNGYIKAFGVIEAELKRLIEEHKDGSDRLERDKGLLE